MFEGTTKKRILIVAPHPDDETLGCGGSAAKWAAEGHDVSVLIVSGHLPPLYDRSVYDQTIAEGRAAFDVLGISLLRCLEVPATFVHREPVHTLNQRIGAAISDFSPHVVLCSYPDRHVDHRVIFDSVMVVTRPMGAATSIQLLAAYETLSETHWNAPHIEPNFVPNWVVDISRYTDVKLRALACYKSQIPEFPGSRSLGAAEALATFRGTQAGFARGEAFHIIRMIT